MKLRISGVLAVAAFVVVCLFDAAQTHVQNAYITNNGTDNVSVINTATNTVITTIRVGKRPFAVAASPDGSKVFVTNDSSNLHPDTMSVIDTATNTVTATIPVGVTPVSLAVSPDGRKLYLGEDVLVNNSTGKIDVVSVIDTATN